ncbi:MAG: RNA polymerase sigma factor [Bacteroidales bacterium]|nr:RNA polymerase sigma factor [Bacteroidales bacterium]
MLGFNIVLERARKGNEQSLMRLYDLCCDTVFNASYRIVMNAQDAEEITQDAFLKTFENLDSFSGSERDFVAFVKTVAINKSIDMFRKHSKEPFYEEIDNTADQIEDDTDFEDFPIEKIKEALNNLPDGYRLTITLRLIDGLEFSEIAERMGIKESSVRSQYARGLEKLRSNVTAQYNEVPHP